jgi:hypothetical protein
MMRRRDGPERTKRLTGGASPILSACRGQRAITVEWGGGIETRPKRPEAIEPLSSGQVHTEVPDQPLRVGRHLSAVALENGTAAPHHVNPIGHRQCERHWREIFFSTH